MFDFERDKPDKPGMSALLRLLRALEFTKIFLERTVIAPVGSISSKQIAWDVYKETLYKRHSKAIQMSIWMATATIPKRETLEKTMKIGETETNSSDKAFAEIDKVYKQIHQIYENENLLELVSVWKIDFVLTFQFIFPFDCFLFYKTTNHFSVVLELE